MKLRFLQNINRNGGNNKMNLTELKKKAMMSNIASDMDEVIEEYRGYAIIEDEKGFNSRAEVDDYLDGTMQELFNMGLA